MSEGVTARAWAGRVVLAAVAFPMLFRVTPPERWILAYAGSVARPGTCTYSIDDFTRLITVVDSTGQSQFWLTNGVILLQLFAPSGRVFEPALGGARTDGGDWQTYLDSLFATGGILARLDSAVALATTALGPPPTPFRVSVMIPYPDARETPFTFMAMPYQLWTPRGRRDVALTYVDQVERRFVTARVQHLSLDGFYWLHELVPSSDAGLVASVAAAVHVQGRRLLWIPYYDAPGWEHWRSFGFDEAWLQPNYFFDRAIPATRLDSAASRAARTGMGLEIEFDARVVGNPLFTDRLGPYLAAITIDRDLREGSIAVYDGGGALAALSRSRMPDAMMRYHELWTSLLR